MQTGYYDLKRPEILTLIPKNAKTILDLGCGTGALGKSIKERQACHVTGIELQKEAYETAKTNLDVAIKDNINRFCPCFLKQKFDCMIFADILEHLISPWAVLRKFAYKLKDNGTIIASIPNIAHPRIIAHLQKGVFRYEPAGILDITHLRFFTKTSIGQLFYQAGLKIKKITPYPSEENPIQYHVTAIKPIVEHKNPLATILIVTYNTWKFTAQAIASIKSLTEISHKILVIDNGSTDETVERLREDDNVFHIENSTNTGFACGYNTGMLLIDTPFFVISNSDVVVTRNWLKRMIEHLQDDPLLMGIGPRSNYVSGPQIVKDCTYKTETELHTYAERFGIFSKDPVVYFHRLVFFFILFRREALTKIGFLDERYHLGNFEDDDYCLRVIRKGYKLAIDNTVFIHHYGSTTFKTNNIDFKKSMEDNQKKFKEKWRLK